MGNWRAMVNRRLLSPRASNGRLGFWLIFALALWLSVWKLEEKNLWLDESVSWNMATSSVTHLVSLMSVDIHPPLYYVALKGWIWIFGDSLAGLRSLSVVTSLLALYLMFRLAEGVLPTGIALAALLWYAVSPHTVHYSQEARMYASATAAVLGCCLAYRHWVDSGFRNRSALVAYTGCVTVALYVHYFTALVVVAIGVHAFLLASGRYAVAGHPSRFPWKAWLLAHIAVGVLCAPWAATAIAQITQGQPWRAPVTLGQIPADASKLVRMLTFDVYRVPLLWSLPCVVVLLVLTSGLVRATVRALWNRGAEREAFFVLVVFVPLLIGLAALPITGHLNLARYLAYSTPLAILAAAHGLSSLRVRPAYVIGALIIGGIAPYHSLEAYYASAIRDYDARPIVNYLSKAARHGPEQPQDRIFVAPGFVLDVVRYLSRGDLAYQRVDSDADLWNSMNAGGPNGTPIWLIVDYRWPSFAALVHDERLEEQPVPLGMPDQIKLFRSRVK